MASKICVFTSSAFNLEDAVEDFNKNIGKTLINVLFDNSQYKFVYSEAIPKQPKALTDDELRSLTDDELRSLLDEFVEIYLALFISGSVSSKHVAKINLKTGLPAVPARSYMETDEALGLHKDISRLRTQISKVKQVSEDELATAFAMQDYQLFIDKENPIADKETGEITYYPIRYEPFR